MIRKKKLFETLRKEKEFDLVFRKGKVVKNEKSKVRAHYLLLENSEKKSIKIAVSVSTKAGSSVWRNRFRRIIKESLRLETETLSHIAEDLKTEIIIVFFPHKINQRNKNRIFLNDIRADVLDILNYICRKLKQQNPA